MDKYLNHYQQSMYLWSPVKGMENVRDEFSLDYRNTMDPIHEENSVTFKFVGEFFYNNQGCNRFVPVDMPRLLIGESFLAMSPTAVECIFEQMAKTKVGKFEMNQKSLQTLFENGESHILTTSSLRNKIPIFEQKLGKDKPLNFVLSYKDMKVDFKRYIEPGDYNVRMNFKLLMGVFYDQSEEHMHLNLPKEEIMYDEI